MIQKQFKLLLLIVITFLSFNLYAEKADKFVYTNTGFFGEGNKFAIEGYDAVAYFKEGKPVKGNKKFKLNYKGDEWHFKNEKNLTLFKENPSQYAPQYGGHCAWRLAQDGKGVYGDATIWTIVDNKLYLNFNKEVNSRWVKDIPSFIKKADNYWLKQFKELN